MVRHEVCTLTALDDEKAFLTNTKKEKYEVSSEVYFDKKTDEIKLGDYVTLEYDGREQAEDGSFTPNVISISYLELRVDKLPKNF